MWCVPLSMWYPLLLLFTFVILYRPCGTCRTQQRWQMRIKRGLHSLARHAELQLLYVAPGLVAEGLERQAMRKVEAAEKYR